MDGSESAPVPGEPAGEMSSVDAEVLEELAQPFFDRKIQRNTYTGVVDRSYSVTHLACQPLRSQASAITVLLRSAFVC